MYPDVQPPVLQLDDHQRQALALAVHCCGGGHSGAGDWAMLTGGGGSSSSGGCSVGGAAAAGGGYGGTGCGSGTGGGSVDQGLDGGVLAAMAEEALREGTLPLLSGTIRWAPTRPKLQAGSCGNTIQWSAMHCRAGGGSGDGRTGARTGRRIRSTFPTRSAPLATCQGRRPTAPRRLCRSWQPRATRAPGITAAVPLCACPAAPPHPKRVHHCLSSGQSLLPVAAHCYSSQALQPLRLPTATTTTTSRPPDLSYGGEAVALRFTLPRAYPADTQQPALLAVECAGPRWGSVQRRAAVCST